MPHCPAHLRWFALFLLLLSAALPSTTSTSSSTTAPAPSDAASPARPPSRSTTPALPRLHILSSLQLASFSHAVAPFEICKRLAARGHRITWVDMVVHEHWYTADERREAGFHRWLKAGDDVYTNWSAAWEQWSGKHVEGGMAGLNDFSRYLMEPLYVPSMHTLQRLIDEDRPDAMICDAFAHSCVDIAEHLGIPFGHTNTHQPRTAQPVATAVFSLRYSNIRLVLVSSLSSVQCSPGRVGWVALVSARRSTVRR